MTTVSLGTCTDDPRKINKSFTASVSPTCEIYGDCSIHNPRLLLAYENGMENYNYAQIFGRSYWIQDIILKPGKRCELNLKEDVLMSHAQEILALNKFRVSRNEFVGQPKMYDDQYPSRVDNNIVIAHFSEADIFNSDSYLVTVLGGLVSS